MNYRNDLTAEYVRECLEYNPETGLLKWKTRPVEHFKSERDYNAWNSNYAGKNAGSNTGNGYIRIVINNQPYKAHRLAWLIFYGKWPKDQIDHNDGERSNNKIDNLRDVPNSINGKNQAIRIDNNTGHVGVKKTKYDTWEANIKVDGIAYYLGSHKNIEDAIKVRKEAEINHNFHPNHGRKVSFEKVAQV
jgi:hypothetical protein